MKQQTYDEDKFYCTACKTDLIYGARRCPKCNKKLSWAGISLIIEKNTLATMKQIKSKTRSERKED